MGLLQYLGAKPLLQTSLFLIFNMGLRNCVYSNIPKTGPIGNNNFYYKLFMAR